MDLTQNDCGYAVNPQLPWFSEWVYTAPEAIDQQDDGAYARLLTRPRPFIAPVSFSARN